MAIIVNSADPNATRVLDHYQYGTQLYNGLDCCITVEVWRKRLDHFDANTWMTYLNEKDIQAPALEMQLRGIHIDETAAQSEINTLSNEIATLESYFRELMLAAYGKEVNWRSPDQLKKMLNGLGFSCRGTDRDTLESLRIHFYAEPIVNCILALRDRDKLRSNLANSRRQRTGRWHASFKVAGTTTGRLSSSKDPFGEGWNLQNLNDRTRRVFIAPEGWKLGYVDLEQAESRAVAYLSGDENYIAACESGDLHTIVCRMVWPELAWTGDLKSDKKVAQQIFYRFFTYRDMSKRGGHGTNYYGKAYTMAKHLKVPRPVMEDFQERYLERFPGISEWWYRVMKDLMTDGYLMTPFGRFRRFFGRPDDDSTIRKAIAFEPQSLVCDILNTGLWRLWHNVPEVKILAQVHDAVLFMFPEEGEKEIIPKVTSTLEIPIKVHDRTMVIPAEANTGWNWGHEDDTNPGGIREWSGEDDRKRPKQSDLLDALC